MGLIDNLDEKDRSDIHPALLDYLKQRQADLANQRQMDISNRGLDLEHARNQQGLADYSKAFAQIGTLGGKAADTSPVQQGAGTQIGLQGQMEKQEQKGSELQEKAATQQGKLAEYLDQAQQRRQASAEKNKIHQEDTQQRSLDRESQSGTQMAIAGMHNQTLKDLEGMRQQGKENKPDKMIEKEKIEANYRYDNMISSAKKLKELINTYGTSGNMGIGASGPQMDKLLFDVAVDYAKFDDPKGVATQGKINAALKHLLPIRNHGGYTLTNDTAKQLVDQLVLDAHSRKKAQDLALGSAPPGAVRPSENYSYESADKSLLPAAKAGAVKPEDAYKSMVGGAASTEQPAAQETIKVISPTGKSGVIPIEDWESAQKEGYRKAE